MMLALLVTLLVGGLAIKFIVDKVRDLTVEAPRQESVTVNRCPSRDYMDIAKTVQVWCELEEGHQGYHRTHIDWSVGTIVERGAQA